MATLAWRLQPSATSMAVRRCAAKIEERARARLASSVARVLCLCAACAACESERSVLLAKGSDVHAGLEAPALPSGGAALVTSVNLEPYPFDGIERTLGARQLTCPEVELVEHAGAKVELVPHARVAPPFVSRLIQLEQVVHGAATQLYARPPSKILLAASYDCRSVGGDDQRLSEHALGNAIDVVGFVFEASPGWPETPTPLPGAFEVRVERHWKNKGDPALERHARFLDAVTRELVERRVFRTLLGPSHPDHADHFHFDMAPEDYVHL